MDEHLDVFIQRLASLNHVERDAAATALINMGSSAVEKLVEALGAEDWATRYMAAYVLGFIGDRRALQPLVSALSDREVNVRVAVAEALRNFLDLELALLLMPCLEKGDVFLRETAKQLLAEVGRASVMPLIAALRDGGTEVKAEAAEVLGRIGDPLAVDALLEALNSGNTRVKVSAMDALGKIGDKRATRTLLKFLGAQEPLKYHALCALEKIGDPEARSSLREALECEKVPYIREQIKRTLSKIGGDNC